MTGSVTLVVHLYLDPDRRTEYESYEAAASRIMARYGGRIERRIGVRADGKETPDEIHVVTFPSAISFAEYARDSESESLCAQRERVIRRTMIFHGADLSLFA